MKTNPPPLSPCPSLDVSAGPSSLHDVTSRLQCVPFVAGAKGRYRDKRKDISTASCPIAHLSPRNIRHLVGRTGRSEGAVCGEWNKSAVKMIQAFLFFCGLIVIYKRHGVRACVWRCTLRACRGTTSARYDLMRRSFGVVG